MAKLLGDTVSLDALTVETIEKARDTISELAKRNHDMFLVDVPSGGDLRSAVARALEEIGRAFGAVRIYELTRSGSYHGNSHARSLGSFPFDKWSRFRDIEPAHHQVQLDPRAIRAQYLQEVSSFIKRIETGCGQMNIDHVPLSTHHDFDVALAGYLAHRRSRQ